MSIQVIPTDSLPLQLLLPLGESGLYPVAHVFDENDAEVLGSPFDLSHVAYGFYSNYQFVVPPLAKRFSAVFIVYEDLAHTVESAVYSRSSETFTTAGTVDSNTELQLSGNELVGVLDSESPEFELVGIIDLQSPDYELVGVVEVA